MKFTHTLSNFGVTFCVILNFLLYFFIISVFYEKKILNNTKHYVCGYFKIKFNTSHNIYNNKNKTIASLKLVVTGLNVNTWFLYLRININYTFNLILGTKKNNSKQISLTSSYTIKILITFVCRNLLKLRIS